MGLIGQLKGMFAKPGQTAKPTWETYTGSLVTSQEAIIARWRDVTTARLVAQRVHGPALGCATINAKMCASASIRMYRPASGAGKSMRRYGAKAVPYWKKARLTDCRQIGRKASMMAESAGDVVEVTDHPVLDLLQRPNPEQTGTEYELERWIHKWLFGNDIHFVVPGGAGVSALVSLMPQYVRVQPDKEKLISMYWFGRDEVDVVPIDAEDIIHLKFLPHWNNPYWGMCPLDIVFREMDLYEYSLAAEQARWQNGGYPGAHLGLEGVKDADQLEQIRQSIERQVAGADKAGRTLVTTKGTYTQMGKTNEMGYIPGMEHIQQRVEQEYGIPEALRRLNDANLASGQMGPDMYLRFTITPALSVDAEQWTERLLPRFGIEPGDAWLAYDDVIPDDIEAIRQDTAVHVAGGVIKINEQRARLGLEPVDGGDNLRVNGVPLAQVGAQPAAPAFSPSFTIPPSFRSAPEPETKAHTHNGIPCEEAGRGKDATDGLQADELADEDKRIIEAMRADVEKWSERVASGLRVGPDGAVDLSGFDADLREALLPKISDLLERGFLIASEELQAGGVEPVRLGDEAAAAIARERGSLIIEQIRGTTEEGIRSSLVRGVEEGRPLNEVIDDLKGTLGEQAGARAELIARTETSNAVSQGRLAVWGESGIKRVRWRLAPGACPICTELVRQSGGVVELGKPFAKAGTALADFTPKRDVLAPPAHPNCVLPNTSVLPGSVIAATLGRYSGDIVTVRTKGGRRLSVTPNHRILTGGGFVQAVKLNPGDDVVCRAGLDRIDCPDGDDLPAVVEQVFRTLLRASKVPTMSVPPSPMHFHGDGSAFVGEVDVVAPYGLLGDHLDASQAEQFLESYFKRADPMLKSLTGRGDLDAVLLAVRLTAYGRVGGSRDALAFLGRGLFHAERLRFFASTLLDPSLIEPPNDGGSVNAEALRQLLDADALRDMELDEVVGVTIDSYSGHVYDLSTVSGAYVAEGIVTHNCRCGVEPVFEDEQ